MGASPDPSNRLPAAGTAWKRKLTLYSTLAGAAELIPVPVLDDYTRRLIRRQMVRDLFRLRSSSLNPDQLRLMSGTTSVDWFSRGCLYLLTSPLRLGIYVLRKIFRKIFFLITLKKAADETVQVFQEGYLLDYAFRRELIRADAFDEARLQRVRWALEETIKELNPMPIRKSLQRLYRSGRGALKRGSEWLQRRGEESRRGQDPHIEIGLEEEKPMFEPFLQQVDAELWNHPEYLQRLEARFEARVHRGPALHL